MVWPANLNNLGSFGNLKCYTFRGAVLVSGPGPPTNTKMCCVSVKL